MLHWAHMLNIVRSYLHFQYQWIDNFARAVKLQAGCGIKLCKAQREREELQSREQRELNKLVRFPYHICGEMTTVKVKIFLADFSIWIQRRGEERSQNIWAPAVTSSGADSWDREDLRFGFLRFSTKVMRLKKGHFWRFISFIMSYVLRWPGENIRHYERDESSKVAFF